MGPIPQHKPRADFTLGFFEVAGFKVLSNTGFATSEEAAEAALASGAPIVVVCSTDATYPIVWRLSEDDGTAAPFFRSPYEDFDYQLWDLYTRY